MVSSAPIASSGSKNEGVSVFEKVYKMVGGLEYLANVKVSEGRGSILSGRTNRVRIGLNCLGK